MVYMGVRKLGKLASKAINSDFASKVQQSSFIRSGVMQDETKPMYGHKPTLWQRVKEDPLVPIGIEQLKEFR